VVKLGVELLRLDCNEIEGAESRVLIDDSTGLGMEKNEGADGVGLL
jgi:hypothetical protein